MSTTADFENHVHQTADAYASTLADLWERIDNSAGQRGDAWDEDDARNELNDLPLEIVWEKGEPFAVVLGTGGPHVEITGGGRQGGYELTVYWSSVPVKRRGEAITRTGEYFRELYEEVL